MGKGKERDKKDLLFTLFYRTGNIILSDVMKLSHEGQIENKGRPELFSNPMAT